jgi:hypothetical protein
VFEGSRFDVLLVAARDLALVAVGVEVLQVRGDGGVGGADCCVVGCVGFGDCWGEGGGEGAEAGWGGLAFCFCAGCWFLPLDGAS